MNGNKLTCLFHQIINLKIGNSKAFIYPALIGDTVVHLRLMREGFSLRILANKCKRKITLGKSSFYSFQEITDSRKGHQGCQEYQIKSGWKKTRYLHTGKYHLIDYSITENGKHTFKMEQFWKHYYLHQLINSCTTDHRKT